MDSFDIKQYSLPNSKYIPEIRRKSLPRHKPGEKFLKGPIPWNWLTIAAKQSGKTLHVAIVIWFLAGIKKAVSVTLSSQVLREFGVDRHAKGRAIKQLEQAQLISVERSVGRSPKVTILEIKEHL